MSLACCYVTEGTPYCENRRVDGSPMCRKHLNRTIRDAIWEGQLPGDCFREIVQYTDYALQVKKMARDYETSLFISGVRADREREGRRRKIEDCVVYYVRLTGGRIKIGWTTDLETRLRAFRSRLDDLLGIEEGGQPLEAHRHKQFAHLRIGRSEDFREAPDLLAHIESLKASAA